MVQRQQDHDIVFTGIYLHFFGYGFYVGKQVVIGKHHTFRAPGGAGSVDDNSGLFRVMLRKLSSPYPPSVLLHVLKDQYIDIV